MSREDPPSRDRDVDLGQFEPSVHWRNRDAPSADGDYSAVETPVEVEAPQSDEVTIEAPPELVSSIRGPVVSLDGPDLWLTRFPAPARWATRGHFEKITWPEVLQLVSKPELWPGQGSIESSRSRLPGWTFAQYRDDSRVAMRDAELAARETAKRVEAVYGLAVEYEDEPTVDADHIERWWGDHCFVAHTTGFHEQDMGDRPPGPRWRVLIPFSEPVSLADAVRIAAWARHSRHDVGILAASSDAAWRFYDAPAIAPGGYRWTARPGPLLDPRAALRQLEEWHEADVEHRAQVALAGTSIEECVQRFLGRHDVESRHPFFTLPGGRPDVPRIEAEALAPVEVAEPWSKLTRLSGGLWPGRVVAVVGAPGSGRSSLALQLAESAAAEGQPVLLVTTRSGTDDAVARLLSLRARGGVPAWALLQGGGEVGVVTEAAIGLAEALPGLHVWAPTWADRTLEKLSARVRSTSDAHGQRPPLVVVDAVEGWAAEADPAREARMLASALRDVAHPGSLEASWPGAGVVLVSGAALEGAAVLAGATVEPSRTAHALGPVAEDASLVWWVVTAPPAQDAADPRDAVVVVARNREGPTGRVALRFEPVPGRFHEA